MKEYTKLEVVEICMACKSIRELIKVGASFGYLARNGVNIPFYVIEAVNYRLRSFA